MNAHHYSGHRPIIAVAPNGAYKQKSDHANLPLSTLEIVNTAVGAAKAGASLLHLHIRDQQNQHSLNAERYIRTIAAIENALGDSGNDLIIQITSEAANRYAPAEQIKTIKQVKPKCVSIALRELAPENEPPQTLIAAQDCFHWCAEHQCHAQYILYSSDDLSRYFDFISQGIIPKAPHSVLFVLGRYSQNQQSSVADLNPYLEAFLPHQNTISVPWMICAFGASEQACLISAAKQGGHCRIGFENNLFQPSGSMAKDNTEQIGHLKTALLQANITPATVSEARKLLQIF